MHPNPALEAFGKEVASRGAAGWKFVEVRIQSLPDARFQICHDLDSESAVDALKRTDLPGLRHLARSTSSGAFRPNQAAPGLRAGWYFIAESLVDLGRAIDHLYPGSVADWYAGRLPEPPVTQFKEFTHRQTGLYRITQILPPALAVRTVQTCCDGRFCLRRRLWTTDGLAPDAPQTKSDLPCLEPCALLLDLARRAMKLEQEEKVSIPVAGGDLPVLIAALEQALDHPDPSVREGNTQDAANPRRIQLLLASLRPHLPAQTPTAGE